MYFARVQRFHQDTFVYSSVLQSRTNRVHGCLSELLEWADNVMLRREEASLLAAQKIILSLQAALTALVEYYSVKDHNNGGASVPGGAGDAARKLTSRPATANGLSHSKSEWCVSILSPVLKCLRLQHFVQVRYN